jgi:putative transposase
MPWRSTKPMDQRVMFIGDWLTNKHTMQELCQLYSVSRKTGYKWVGRYEELGVEGLKEQSRRPEHCPHEIPYRIRKELIELRKVHGWGAKKLLKVLERRQPEWTLPARSTTCELFRREGLVKVHKPHRKLWGIKSPFGPATSPNDVWTADFKGQFKLRNGVYCYPLTVMDGFSRYVLECRGFYGTRGNDTKTAFRRLFDMYGMPSRIRTDNGVPFATTSVGALSKLSIWWIHLGIWHDRITPGRPQENGSHERMHRSLKEKTALQPSRSFQGQQLRFDKFCDEYNHERPHESLGMQTPSELYKTSTRMMPERLPPIEYPNYFEQHLVHHSGVICRGNRFIYIGYILRGEHLGLEEIADGVWNVYFGPVLLGRYSEEIGKFVEMRNKIHKV